MTRMDDDAARAREDSFLAELVPQVAEHVAAQRSGEHDAARSQARFMTWLAVHRDQPVTAPRESGRVDAARNVPSGAGLIGRFLARLSGASPHAPAKYPGQRPGYAGIGTGVLLLGVTVGAALTLVLGVAAQPAWEAALPAALTGGAAALAVNRMRVASLRHPQRRRGQLGLAGPGLSPDAGERMTEGLAQAGRLGLGTALLTDFLETASQADGRVNPLLQRLARREIERVTSFVRQLPTGTEIAYEGEDREWLLGLTREAERSIDAISLSTVDAGIRGLDGGLWTSDLGTRYLELQREAIARHVCIRRIFVFENEDLARDEAFLKITQMQRDAGVEARMLDHQLIPDWMQSMSFDFIVFDGAVSYETTPTTTFTAGQTRLATVQTLLSPVPARARHLEDQFEQLWEAADPERQIDE